MKASYLAIAGVCAVASGCAGGGGGGGGSMSQPAQNLQAAQAPSQPVSVSGTLSAVVNGNTVTAIYSETPNAGTTAFDGQVANNSTVSLTITENGDALATELSTAYYLENPYVPLGLSGTTSGVQWEFLFASINPLPTTLTVGSSGPIGSGSYYLAGTNTIIGSLTETYAVTANNPTTLLLTTYATGTINGQAIEETLTCTVSAAGVVALQSLVEIVNGTTVTFNLT